MLFQELPTVFPWYFKKENQARFNLNTDEPCGASLLTPKDCLLPFQIRKPETSELPQSVQIFGTDDVLFADVTTFFLSALKTAARNGFDYLTFLGNDPATVGTTTTVLDMTCGDYYAKMTFPDGQILWSECFQVPAERFTITDPTTCKFLMLEWSSPVDVAPIFYSDLVLERLTNRLYLDSNIYNSEPEIEVEGTKNGDNELIKTFQKVTVPYRINALLPDFVKLALTVMPIHDTISLKTEYNKRSGSLLNVTVTSKPDENGYFSDVEILFTQDIAIIRRGCGENMAVDPCPDLPSDVDLNLRLTQQPNGIVVQAALPVGMFAAIYTSLTNTIGSQSYAPAYRENLVPGILVPWQSLNGDYFTLLLKTFNCVIGYPGTKELHPALPYHPYAMDFFQAIESDAGFIAASGSLSGGEKTAIDTFIRALISANLWGKFNAIYPFLGSLADSHKYNLVDPRNLDAAYRFTFPNGATHGTLGVAFTSTSSQYGETHLVPTSSVKSLSFAIQNSGHGDRGIAGAFVGSSQRIDSIISGVSQAWTSHLFSTTTGLTYTYGANPQTAIHIASRMSATEFRAYYNGALVNTVSTADTGIPPTNSIWLGAINGLISQGYSNDRFSFFAVGQGLDNTSEANDFSTIVSDLLSDLGR